MSALHTFSTNAMYSFPHLEDYVTEQSCVFFFNQIFLTSILVLDSPSDGIPSLQGIVI